MVQGVGLTIGPLARRFRLDQRLRAWVRGEVKSQQTALGQALEQAGVVPAGRGQVWVSRYSRGGSAVATIDHVIVIADFFERSVIELLSELGYSGAGTEARLQQKARTEKAGETAEEVRAFLALPADFRSWLLQHPMAEQLPLPQAAVSKSGRPAASRTKSGQGPRR